MTETPTRTRPAGLLYAQAAEYQDRLEGLERAATAQMRAAWYVAEDAIQADLDALLAKVGQAQAAGTRTSPAWAFQEARLRAMLDTTAEQVDLFSRTAAEVTQNAQRAAALQATTAAPSLASAAMAEVGLSQAFDAIQPANLTGLVGFLQDGSPLSDLFDGIGPLAATQARDTLTTGLVLGRGVDRIRRDMLQTIQMPRHRAETIVRTETHRVFRETSRRTYAQNADVVTGWTWLAGLGPRCCPGCVRMHGTTHPVTDTLDGHPRCRCVMVPRVPDQDLAVQPGLEWLKDQPERTQRAVLGPGKFAAWKDGRLDLEDLVTRTEDPRWGTMRREATLAEALAAKGRARVPSRPAPVVDPVERARTLNAQIDGLQRTMDPASPEFARRMDELVPQLREAQAAVRAHRAAHPDWFLADVPRRDMTPAQALADANPLFATDRAYQVNCTHATATWELRRRGYNVQATPLPQEFIPRNGRDAMETTGRWLRPDGTPATLVPAKNVTTVRKFATEWGQGARGWVVINWKGGGGHIFSVENVGGKVVFSDPQNPAADAAGFIARASPGRVWAVRVDNLTPTEGVQEFYTPAG